ncbi:Cytochrome P450 [Paenibacillus sp. RU4T]|nr:Cytochrome P450 [Paenibacillus sp. RU4X]SIQ37043.1 Cytochrome P450 [Paenibacillus sp. RU4T]
MEIEAGRMAEPSLAAPDRPIMHPDEVNTVEWNEPQLIPLDRFRELRRQSPVERFEGEGYAGWRLFGYDEVKAAFTDYERFSSQGEQNPDDPIDSSILRQDPPKHRQLRMLVSKAFTPRVIESMEPAIRKLAEELFDKAAAKPRFDVMEDLASPLPISVIARMLGIPEGDLSRFKQWSEDLVGTNQERYVQCQREMSSYFSAVAAERRLEPRDDLISNLVQAKVDGEQLSEIELIGFCILLLVAGNETTTNLITSIFLCLDSLPEVREELIADRTLIPSAIEEVFRYFSPVQMMFRSVKRDTELGGMAMKAGDPVFLYIASANHDEKAFPEPERFDIRRSPNAHVGLGSGIHYCLGAQLARLESRIVLETLLERYPRFSRDRSVPLERIESNLMFGLRRLPVFLKR